MRALLITFGPRDILAPDSRARLAQSAGIAPEEVVEIDRLADRAMTRDVADVAVLFSDPQPWLIGTSRPRAARALLAYAEVDLSRCLLSWLALPFDRESLQREYGVPWYPVIDTSRCTECGTCADYCLFSVYRAVTHAPKGERIAVIAPHHCKTGCPACARLCPTGALIFPFCHEAELNGEIEAPILRTQDSITAALGDDPLRVLAERRQKKRLIDPSKFEQAEKDRITHSGVL